MLVPLGVAAIAASVLLYAWAFGLSRDPRTPRWAHGQLFASTVSLVLVGLVPVGAGLVSMGLMGPDDMMDYAGLVEAVVLAAVLWVLVPRLVRVRSV